MANVQFLRGTHQKLQSLTSYKEGAFYLTTDTDRLMFAQSATELVDLNKYVIVKATIGDLPPIGDAKVGDFYYLSTPNILATKATEGATEWTQINPDTKVAANSQNTSAAISNNTVTVKSEVADTIGNKSEGSFKITGGDNVTVTLGENNEIIITSSDDVNTTYSLGLGQETVEGDQVHKVVLSGSDGSSDYIGLKGTGKISLTQQSDVITITSADTPITVNTLAFDAQGKLTSTVSTSDGGKTAEITPEIKLGNNTPTYKFANGVAELPVYTKEEVDAEFTKRIKEFDAMVYRGIIREDDTLPTSNVQIGDVYKAGRDSVDSDPVQFKTGDLIIAQGTETDGVITSNLSWDVIPSGDDQLITGGTYGTNGISIKDHGVNIAAIDVVSGKSIAVTSSRQDGVSTVTVAHGAPQTGTAVSALAAEESTKQTSEGTLTIPAIKSLSKDEFGHVTDIQIQNYEVTDTHMKINSISTNAKNTTNGKTVDITIATTGGAKTGSIDLISDNLSITSTSRTGADDIPVAQVKVNLEWGSF